MDFLKKVEYFFLKYYVNNQFLKKLSHWINHVLEHDVKKKR